MISNTINYFYSSICVYVLVSLYTGFTSIATTSYRASSTMSWITISFCLGIYGVLKEFRPSESYVVPYLLGPRMNFTEEQVNNEILPIGIYASMISMIFVALTTDWLRYKIVMVIQALCGVGVYALLSLCTSFTSIVVVEILYGIFDATEVAYSTYIYSVVNVKYYQKVTSYTRAAFLIGRFFSGFLAQIFISTKLVDTYQLNFLTLGSLMAATIWALVLPSIKNNKLTSENYNMKVTSPKTVTQNVHEHDVSMEKNIENKHITWKYIRSMCNEYTNMYVLKWSFWVITSTCCFQQVTNYIQSLWESLSCNDCPHSVCKSTSEWNGAVDAVYTIISTFVTFFCGSIKFNLNKYGNTLIVITSIIHFISLLTSAVCSSIYLAYINYIIYCTIYQGMLTIASSEIAKSVNRDKHGFVFGVNTLLATTLQSLAVFFMNTIGWSSSPKISFQYYAIFCLLIGMCYLFITTRQLFKK